MFSIKEISKYVHASSYAVQTYLKKNDLKCMSTYEANAAKLVNKIQRTYEDTKILSSLFITFSNYDAIINFIDTLNIKITDDVIVDLFSDKAGMFAKSRYLAMKLRINKGLATRYELDSVHFFDIRFDDSTCLAETYMRLKYKIFKRPVCEECGKPVKFIGSKKHGVFQRFCCRRCSNSNELTKSRVREFNIKTYGVPVTSQAQCVKDKAKKHFKDVYGVDNPWQSKEIQDISKKTKKLKYGNETYNNRKQSEQTCLRKYGVKVSSQNADVQRKAAISYHIIMMENFGVEWPMQNTCIKAKYANTCLTNYGSTSYLSSNDFKNKCLELYGVENPMQCPEIQKKTILRYRFNELSFDSAPEIAFFIWLKDNNIEFEYQPNISFDYMHNGKLHKYFPDFKIGDMFFEIKGDHFFKDGKMICPYRDKTWTDEQYMQECNKYEAKHWCMLKNDIVILRNAEYAMFV